MCVCGMFLSACVCVCLVRPPSSSNQVSRLAPHQIDALVAPRFGDALRAVISGCLLRDPAARPTAEACLGLLAPKEAARLRGDSVRGWRKRHPKPPNATAAGPRVDGSDDESVADTSSGSDPEDGPGGRGGEWMDEDEHEDGPGGQGGARRRAKRFGVPEAVARAEHRVRLFQREAWWRRLEEPARQELLRRRRCRVEARAR